MFRLPFFSVRLLVLASLSLTSLPELWSEASSPPLYTYFRAGNAAAALAATRPGYALMGGGSDLDQAFRWLCERAGGGDFLVLRATGNDEYNSYIRHLCHVNSVATLVIPSRAAAADPFVEQAIRQASGLFISGGDQANYINFWQGTPVQAALNDAIRRGVPIGGTSAGLAVMGEYAYTAQADKPDDPNLDGKTALANPYNPRVTLNAHFLEISILKGTITDTHFAKRNRMGRLLTFLARLTEPEGNPIPGAGLRIRGIGVDERAAVLVDPDGQATVIGRGGAYFMETKGSVEVLEPGKPLTFRDVAVQKVTPGRSFNLKTWQGDATRYTLSVEAGSIHSSQPGGSIY